MTDFNSQKSFTVCEVVKRFYAEKKRLHTPSPRPYLCAPFRNHAGINKGL